ncbi:LADA_0D09054g1_1 [Lachancea dasiensis]|uniref:LADA_0D09054g1_1 n=1 Tax=Lachancea dasiensis TaxID=1072105 RepID=A0A1G4J760_9SACH|nr:LADA_0D09054g1_1 [Lachancea dasiensis]
MNKRSRRACNSCKSRKKRCDGREPVCGRCAERGLSGCTYSHHLDRRRPFTKAYVDSLTEQIKTYRNEIKRLRLQSASSGSIERSQSEPLSNSSQDEDTEAASDTDPKEKSIAAASYWDGRIDRFGKLQIANDGTFRFFGPRSIMSFLEHGTKTEDDALSQRRMQAEFSLSNLERHFIDLYFAFQNALFIFVWKRLFEREMELPPASRRRGFFSIGLLRAILAVGSLFYNDSEESIATRGDDYASMACYHLQQEVKSPSLTTVQIAGILAIFYVYKAKDELAWYYCGIAVTTSYTLGLNVENEALQSRIQDYEAYKEVSKISFWGTYFLDKALNSMLGRPTLLKSSSITCTVPGDIGLREFDLWRDPRSPVISGPSPDDARFYREYSQISFTTELLILVEKPLDALYLFFKPSDPNNLELVVRKATTSLIEFEASLPYFMRLNFLIAKDSHNGVSPGLFFFR